MLGHAYPDAVAVRVDHGLEVTVYSAPLGPMMRPLRSPTSSVLPLWLLTRIGGVSAAMAGAVRPMVRATDNSVAVNCFFILNSSWLQFLWGLGKQHNIESRAVSRADFRNKTEKYRDKNKAFYTEPSF